MPLHQKLVYTLKTVLHLSTLLKNPEQEQNQTYLCWYAVSSPKSKSKNAQIVFLEDTGIGIPAEDLPRIFEKGFTGYNGRENKKSTGIGLYLCKNIMDKLQWNITVDSEVGSGTKIYLTKM